MEMAEGEVGVCPSSPQLSTFFQKTRGPLFLSPHFSILFKRDSEIFSDAGFVRIWVRVRIKPEKKILIRPNLGPICPSNIRQKTFQRDILKLDSGMSDFFQNQLLIFSIPMSRLKSFEVVVISFVFRNFLRAVIRYGITFLNDRFYTL